MLENVIKKLFPIRDENNQPCTFPTFASQVFFDDGSVLEGKQFGGGTATVDPLTIYPVGSIYMSVNETSPASLFGGTWEQLKDRFLYGASETIPNDETGGQSEVIIEPRNCSNTIYAMFQNTTGTTITYDGLEQKSMTKAANGWAIMNVLGAKNAGIIEQTPLSIMPPYLAVYMWKRVA